MAKTLAGPEYIEVVYSIETRFTVEEAALRIARGQTFATWVPVGKESRQIEEQYGGKVVAISGEQRNKTSGTYSGTVRIAFPWHNFGARIPNLISNLFGELFELKDFIRVKAQDIIFPPEFIKQFRGPQFGVERTRELLQFEAKRPLIGAIFKPCIGLSNEELAGMAYDVAVGGVDFIKDDEIIGDTYFSSVVDRVRQVMRALRKAEEKTGRKAMYAVNITDRIDQLKDLYDIVYEEKGNCVMVNASAVGLSALQVLAEKTKMPIHAHRVFTAAYTRCPDFGLSMKVFAKLTRLAGADHIHCGGIHGKGFESDEAVLENAGVCLDEMGDMKKALPVNSGGQWAGTVEASLKAFGHTNYLHLFGGGIFGHPAGPEAGAKSVLQAYEAAQSGVPLERYAKERDELAQALKAFNK